MPQNADPFLTRVAPLGSLDRKGSRPFAGSVYLSAMTGMEVLADAVKILGGAVAGGFFSWLGIRSSQKHEFKKALFERRCEILEDIAKSVTGFYMAVTQFHLHHKAYDKVVAQGRMATPEQEEMKKNASREYYDFGRAIMRVRASSYLIPNQKIAELILKVMNAATEYSRAEKSNDANRIKEANAQLEHCHQKLMHELESEFNQPA